MSRRSGCELCPEAKRSICNSRQIKLPTFPTPRTPRGTRAATNLRHPAYAFLPKKDCGLTASYPPWTWRRKSGSNRLLRFSLPWRLGRSSSCRPCVRLRGHTGCRSIPPYISCEWTGGGAAQYPTPKSFYVLDYGDIRLGRD